MWDLLLEPDIPDKDPKSTKYWLENHDQAVQNLYQASQYNLENNPRAAYQQLRRVEKSGVDVTPILDKSIQTFKSVQIVLHLWRQMLRKRSATIDHANLILRLAASWKLKNTALRVLEQMRAHDIEPDQDSHAQIISAIGREHLNNHEEALDYFNDLIESGFKPNAGLYTAMITACKTKESIDVAKNVLQMYLQDENAYKVVKPFNAIIGLTANNGQIDFAIKMLRNLHSFNVYPSASSFFIVIHTIQQQYYEDIELLREAEQLFYQMVSSEIPPMPGTLQAAMDIGERLGSHLLVQSAEELLAMTRDVQDDYNRFSQESEEGY